MTASPKRQDNSIFPSLFKAVWTGPLRNAVLTPDCITVTPTQPSLPSADHQVMPQLGRSFRDTMNRVTRYGLLQQSEPWNEKWKLATSAVTWRVTSPSEAAHRCEQAQGTLRTCPPPISLVLPKRKISVNAAARVSTSLWRFRRKEQEDRPVTAANINNTPHLF